VRRLCNRFWAKRFNFFRNRIIRPDKNHISWQKRQSREIESDLFPGWSFLRSLSSPNDFLNEMGPGICSGFLISLLSRGQHFIKPNAYLCLASQITEECKDNRFYQVSVLSITVAFSIKVLLSIRGGSYRCPWSYR
jgi:hypothetical protein